MVRRAALTLIAAAAAAAALPPPLPAQAFRTSVGVVAGGSVPAELRTGADGSVALAPGGLAGFQLEQWWGGQWAGARFHIGLAERPLRESPNRYRIVAGEVALISRLLPPDPANLIAPFAGIGAGAVAHRGLDGAGAMGAGELGPDPVVLPAVVLFLGVDLLAGSRLGLRVELADQVVVPAARASVTAVGHGHNLEARVALQLRFGRVPPPAPVALPASPPARAEPPASVTDPDVTAALERLDARLDEQARQLARLADRLDAVEREVEAVRAERRTEPEPITRVEPVAPPPPPPAPEPATAPPPTPAILYTVQIGSYADAAAARRLADGARAAGLPVRVSRHTVGGRTVHRVRVGATTSLADAERVARRLGRGYGYPVWVDRVRPGEGVTDETVLATGRLVGG